MATEKLEGDALAKCIEDVENGSAEAAYALACHTFEHDTDDADLMRRRRDFILKHDDSGAVGTTFMLCLISAQIGDLRFCDFWLPAVEEVGELHLGHGLYKVLKRNGGSDEAALRYLRSAADCGYIDAKKELFRLRRQKAGWFGRPLLFVYTLYLSILAVVILLRNREDPRLPIWLEERALNINERGLAAIFSRRG